MAIFESFTYQQWLLFIGIIFSGHFVKGMTGFGSLIILIPFLTLLMGPKAAIVTAIFADTFSGIYLTMKLWRSFRIRWLLPLFIALFIGIYYGSYLLLIIPEYILVKIIALLILGFCAHYIYLSFQSDENNNISGDVHPDDIPKIRWGGIPIGFLTGAMGGSVGISGPPVIIFFKRYMPKGLFRAQLVLIFCTDGILKSGVFLYRGLLTPEMILGVTYTAPVIIGAAILGSLIHNRISEKMFTRIIGILLILPAVKLLFW